MTHRTIALIITSLTALCFSAGCGRGDGRVAPGDWPAFRGGVRRLGTDGESALPDRAPAVAWVFADGRANFPVTFWSSPLVQGGRLYVGGGVVSPFGTRGDIYCLDPTRTDAAGRPPIVWKHKVGRLVFSSPALAGGVLVCGEGTHTDTDTRLYALQADATDPRGRRLWDFPVAGTFEASPTIAGGKVYVGTGDDFYCLDLRTGKPLWRAVIVDVLSSPAVASGMVYVGSGRNEQAKDPARRGQGQRLVALDADTGRVRWSKPLPYACSSPITYADGRVVAGCGQGTFVAARGGGAAGQVVCYDAATGRPLWARSLPDNILAAIPVQNGLVHVACRNGRYYLLALADGRVVWEYKVDRSLLASPIVAGGRVLLVSCRGVACCLDFKARKLLWRMDLPKAGGVKKVSDVLSSPVLSAGRIYVGLASRGLICLSQDASSAATAPSQRGAAP